MNLVIDEGIGKRKDGSEESIGMVVSNLYISSTFELKQNKRNQIILIEASLFGAVQMVLGLSDTQLVFKNIYD